LYLPDFAAILQGRRQVPPFGLQSECHEISCQTCQFTAISLTLPFALVSIVSEKTD
jgi:hypothetical protein